MQQVCLILGEYTTFISVAENESFVCDHLLVSLLVNLSLDCWCQATPAG